MSEASWADLANLKAPLSPREVVRNTLAASGRQWISDPCLDPVEDLTKLQVLHRAGSAVFSDNVLPAEFASYKFRKLLKYLLAVRSQPLGDLARVKAQVGMDIAAIERYFAVLEEIGWLNRVEAPLCSRHRST